MRVFRRPFRLPSVHRPRRCAHPASLRRKCHRRHPLFRHRSLRPRHPWPMRHSRRLPLRFRLHPPLSFRRCPSPSFRLHPPLSFPLRPTCHCSHPRHPSLLLHLSVRRRCLVLHRWHFLPYFLCWHLPIRRGSWKPSAPRPPRPNTQWRRALGSVRRATRSKIWSLAFSLIQHPQRTMMLGRGGSTIPFPMWKLGCGGWL